MNIDVLRASFLTTVQDLGRMGFREFGVSPGGALDSHALRVANLLVGNKESAAGIEITFGGVQLRFVDERVVAWCGGEFDVRIGSTSLPAGHAGFVRAGDVLVFNQPKTGCRSWLGISGGIDVPLVLGSRSTDLRAICGSDSDRFNDVTIQRFTNDVFVVSADSNRMGARLEGPHLQRDHDVDLVSEGVAPGTIQVPPSGQPILLLGDCQTIGGYPKIAHVITVDLPVAAQLR